MKPSQKITPYLWFDGRAEEAARFYTSTFEDGKIISISRHDEASAEAAGQTADSALVVEFELFGQRFAALNGGPQYRFTPAISFFVSCENQDEIDRYWYRLSAVPEEEQCGWLVDKYGLSWQIVPSILPELLADPDPKKTANVMQAMLAMKKIDIKSLEQAHERD